MTEAKDEGLELQGECYCGTIGFSVTLSMNKQDPRTQVHIPAYCSCFDCKRAHAAPLAEAFFVSDTCFTFTRGLNELQNYRKGERAPVRSFCGVCGTRVTVTLPESMPSLVGVFTALLDEATQRNLPEPLVPVSFFHRASSTLRLSILK